MYETRPDGLQLLRYEFKGTEVVSRRDGLRQAMRTKCPQIAHSGPCASCVHPRFPVPSLESHLISHRSCIAFLPASQLRKGPLSRFVFHVVIGGRATNVPCRNCSFFCFCFLLALTRDRSWLRCMASFQLEDGVSYFRESSMKPAQLTHELHAQKSIS